jgi:hypothetical protein
MAVSDWQCEIEGRVSGLETNDKEQNRRLGVNEDGLVKLRDRLPLWATTVIAGLVGALGWLIK